MRNNRNQINYLSTSVVTFFFQLTRTKILIGTIVLLSLTATALTRPGSAATPSNGTITPSSGSLSYSAGPFVVANDSRQGGVITPICQPGTPLCDEYTLTVNAASVAATKKLLIQVQWPN